jgi:hypothetical protein
LPAANPYVHEVKRLAALQSGGLGVANPMRIKLSGLPLCKAGDWGLQTPEKCFCSGFFAASPQKNRTKLQLITHHSSLV